MARTMLKSDGPSIVRTSEQFGLLNSDGSKAYLGGLNSMLGKMYAHDALLAPRLSKRYLDIKMMAIEETLETARHVEQRNLFDSSMVHEMLD